MPFFERLAAAHLWSRQASQYEALGQSAWSEGRVAWRATTCTWVAHFEAELICAFEREARRLGWLDATTPLTVWDVGAGTGRLTFHLARELEARGANVQLLITDVAQSNVEAWPSQPQLKALIDRGVLRTAVMNVLTDTNPLELGPAVMLAHYLFDSLPCSGWRRTDGRIEEAWVRERDDGSFEWEWRAAAEVPSHEVGDEAHLFPDGAMVAIDRFGTVTDERFMLLVVDKGANDTPTLARHHTVSAGLNFAALADATRSLRWFHSTPSPILQFAAATPQGVELPWHEPTLLRLLDRVTALRTNGATLDEIIEVQRALHHDPDTLAQLAPSIRAALPTSTQPQVEALVAEIAEAANRHFVMQQQLDVPFELATLAHACGALRLAESLYMLAVRESGRRAAPLFNTALILRATDREDEAQRVLAEVLRLDPLHQKARDLVR